MVIGLSEEPVRRDVNKYRSEPETNRISLLCFSLVIMITSGTWKEELLRPISLETFSNGTKSTGAAEKQQDPVGLLKFRMCSDIFQLYFSSNDLF